ncbi:MAG: hypothetical protein AB1633_07740 [Elusimicrobiota bacterium]
MKLLTKFSTEAQATLALIIAQILYKLIFELEGAAKMVATGHKLPVVQGVYALMGIWIIIGILCLMNKKIGYLSGIVFGIVNLFPLVLLLMGKTPYVDRPFFNAWITLSLIYFSYRAYKLPKERKKDE